MRAKRGGPLLPRLLASPEDGEAEGGFAAITTDEAMAAFGGGAGGEGEARGPDYYLYGQGDDYQGGKKGEYEEGEADEYEDGSAGESEEDHYDDDEEGDDDDDSDDEAEWRREEAWSAGAAEEPEPWRDKRDTSY